MPMEEHADAHSTVHDPTSLPSPASREHTIGGLEEHAIGYFRTNRNRTQSAGPNSS